MALVQDEFGNWYNDEPGYQLSDNIDIGGGWSPAAPSSDAIAADNIDVGGGWNPATGTGDAATAAGAAATGVTSSASLPAAAQLSGLQQLWKTITGGSGTTSQVATLLPLLAGLSAASKSNVRTQPAGYQGGIPRYTATRKAPAEGQMISGDVTYTPVRAAKGGMLEPGGFVIPADVVSHFGNGSSEAGLKILASKLGATPIKGEGDGMSDSIPTTIDGEQRALVANEEAYLSPDKVERLGGGDAQKGAKRLREMMARIREARTGNEEQGKQINPTKFMPGGEVRRFVDGDTVTKAAPANTTGIDQSLASWAGPYVTDMLAKGQALSEMPYERYTGQLTAGPSALQTQAFEKAGALQTPAAIGQAAQTAGGIAQAAQQLGYTPTQFTSQFQAPGAYQTGTFANQFAAPIQTAATQFTNQYQAPSAYQTGAFDAGTFGTEQAQQYMNPYLQASLNPQLAEARRQADISRLADAARLTKAGAYGGSRQAIMESEGQRNLATQLANITGQGYATAYDKAMAQFNADQARRMQAQQAAEQSRQFGAGQAATAAQLQAQYGLSAQQAQEAARQFNQGQALTAAQLQAQYGLSAQQAQEASRQFGAGQAMTAAQQAAQYGQAAQQAAEQSRQFGAGFGLQGLQTALQAAQAQGQLGASQQQADLAGLNALAGLGATQRAISAEDVAAQKAAFDEARLNPYKMVQFQQSLLQGLPLAAYTYNQTPTNNLSQFAQGFTGLQQALASLGIKV